MKVLRITVVLLTLTGSAFASDVLSDTPENRAKVVDEYLRAIPVRDLLDDMTEKLAATVPEDNRESFKSTLTKHFDLDALVAAEKQSLAKIFTVGELRAMIAYQSTAEGKSSMEKMGAYIADLMPVVQSELVKAVQATAQETQPVQATTQETQLYVSHRPEGGLIGVVSEYNATTGEVINANLVAGLKFPGGLAVSGNKLFVANHVGGTVGEYDATTGAAINVNFITGLGGPAGLALLGNTLFVTDLFKGTVGEYDATTGAAINANLITGLSSPEGIVVKSAK